MKIRNVEKMAEAFSQLCDELLLESPCKSGPLDTQDPPGEADVLFRLKIANK
jgi:hypothetical protein